MLAARSLVAPLTDDWIQEHMLWLFGFRIKPWQLDDLRGLLEGGIYSILWPTDHGKSSVLLQGSVVLGLIREPDRPNIIIKISDDKARETLQSIARKLNRASDRYPRVRPVVRGMNSQFPAVGDGFYVDGGDRENDNPSVAAFSIASKDIQGRRGRTHLDDVESFREARSPAYQAQLEAQVSAAMRTLEPRPDALWLMVGTPYYAESVMFSIPRRLKNLGANFKLIRRPVIDEQGHALWEERRRKAEIHRAAMPSDLEWQVAYMLQPPNYGKLEAADIERLLDPRYPFCATQAAFEQWYAQDASRSTAQRRNVALANWYIGWDPAATGEFGMVVDSIVNEQTFCLDALRMPGDIFTQIAQIADWVQRYPKAMVVIEHNGQQKIISDVLRERLPNVQIVGHMTSAAIKSPEIGIPSMLKRGVEGYLRLPAADERGRGIASVMMREIYNYPGQHGHLLPALWFTTYFHRKNVVVQAVKARTEEPPGATIIPIDMSRINAAWRAGY